MVTWSEHTIDWNEQTTLALPSFVSEFKFASMSPPELALVKANIVSVYQAGAFFGSLMAYRKSTELQQRNQWLTFTSASAFFLGRRPSLWIFAVVFMIGAGIMLDASGVKGLGPIYGGRVLAGVGVGGCSMIVPIYISEISPPAIRGRLVGLYELGWQIGGLVG